MAVLALAAGAGLAAPVGRAEGGAGAAGPALDLYRITAPEATASRLEGAGFDVAATRADGTTEVVLSPPEVARLTAAGFRPTRWRDPGGRSVADLARAQVVGSGSVWRHWDGAG
ncbi:MAG TPA: hypothetical protein VGR20_07745, partial [Acidimicrobiia bacterium]|nr:hypothetical protein [Acidimicrobiia bacterium]